MRAYIFVDDGLPEADEYENNYIAFNPADPAAYRQALTEARRRQDRLGNWPDRMRAGHISMRRTVRDSG